MASARAGAVGHLDVHFAENFGQRERDSSFVFPGFASKLQEGHRRRAEQVRHLREERRHVPRLDPLAPLAAGRRLDQLDAHRKQTARIQHGHDLVLAARGQCPLVAHAGVGQGFISKIRHMNLQFKI